MRYDDVILQPQITVAAIVVEGPWRGRAEVGAGNTPDRSASRKGDVG